jgi:protein O-mannosyl-transferase
MEISEAQERSLMRMAWLMLAGLLILIYMPAFPGPFYLDDHSSIVDNSEIRTLRNLPKVIESHRDVRALDHHPIPAITVMLDYQWAGSSPEGYRCTNLLIHFVISYILFLLLRRVLARMRYLRGEESSKSTRSSDNWLALAVAAVWAVHPLGTMPVAYITGRQESLMVLFYAWTLQMFTKVWDREEKGESGEPVLGAVLLCAVGSMLSKEVAVTLPIALYLFDYAFGKESFIGTGLKRWQFYGMVALVWGMLCWWHLKGGRSGHVAAGKMPLSSRWEYFKAQCGVVLNYYKLVVWPRPLIFYPSLQAVENWMGWVPQLVVLFIYGLSSLVMLSLRRWRWLGFALFLPLLILGPTSSVIAIPYEPAIDYRMYLPSFSLLALGIGYVWRKLSLQNWRKGMVAILVLYFGVFSHLRAWDYRDGIRLFEQQVKNEPHSFNGYESLNGAYMAAKRYEDAREAAEKMLWIGERFNMPAIESRALLRLGILAQQNEAYERAEDLFRRGLEASSNNDIRICLAILKMRDKRYEDADKYLLYVLNEVPDQPRAMVLHASVKMLSGQTAEAERLLLEFERLYPDREELAQLRRLLERKKLGLPID